MERLHLGRLCAATAIVVAAGTVALAPAQAANSLPSGAGITTSASRTAGGLGTATISDRATLAGFPTTPATAVPDGTLTFQLYGPGDTTCSGTVLSTSTATVNGNGSYTSAPFTPTAYGTYNFIVSYAGGTDDTSDSFTGNCGDSGESVTIPQPPAVPGGPPCTPDTPNVYGNGNADGTYGNLGHGNQGNCNVGDGNEGDLNDGNGSASNPPEDE